MTLLQKLFLGNYEAVSPMLSPSQQKAVRAMEPYCQKIQEIFGREFLDQFFDLQSEIDGEEAFLAFRQGIRLGGQIVLEAVRPGEDTPAP